LLQPRNSSTKPTNSRTPIRILHVDDDASILEISKQVLMDMDDSFEFDTACCVDEALKKLLAGHYDVVVSDYEMPQKNGLQFLEELRERGNQIPFILFTGKGREEVAIRALNLGADGYCNKQGSPETAYGELAHSIRRSFEHKKAIELLRESQAELKAIVYNAPLGIATSDSNMMFKSANEAFRRIVGYSEDELQKRSFKDITYPDDIEVSNKDMKELSCGNIPYFSQEKRYVRKDGSIIDGKVTVSAIRNNEGKPVLYVAELEDITQRKQAEAELRRTFNVLERVGESIDAGLAVIGKDYRVVWANKLLMDLGVAPNKKCYQTFNNSETVCIDCGAKKIFEQNVSLDVHEFRTINSQGETTWIELRVTPLKDKDGNITAALELAVPITDRKKAEEVLRKSEEKYRQIVELSTQGLLIVQGTMPRIVFANSAMSKIFGYSIEELTSFSPQQAMGLVHPDDRELFFKRFEERLEGKPLSTQYGARGIRKDGAVVLVEMSSALIEYGGQPAVQAMFTDTTERKKVEEKLRNSELNYRNLINGMPESVWVIDFEGNFLDVNDAAVKMLGYSRDEFQSLGIKGIDSYLSAEQVKGLMSRTILGEAQVFETEHTTKEGKKIPVEISASLITYDGKQRILAVARDITERKKADEESKQTLNQLALVNEKLGVVGSLTRHDVRNKLSTVSAYAYLLKKKHVDQPDIVEGLNKIEEAVADSVKIFEFSRMYERLGVEKLSDVDVGEAVDEATALFSGLTFKVINGCHGKSVLADSFLRQMFYNFIDNTRKYGEKATTIKVYYEQEASGGLRLIYEDDGVGISAENKPKLFNEGFSTGGSTGFGLFFIKKMLDVYGWTIAEEGEPGKGAKFIIRLPPKAVSGKLVFE